MKNISFECLVSMSGGDMGLMGYDYVVCSTLFYLIFIAGASTSPAMVNEYEYYDCENIF